MFAGADAVVLNKADLLEVFAFDLAAFQRGVSMLNPTAPIFVVSSRSGAGIDAWVAWLLGKMRTAGGNQTGSEREL